MSLADGIENDTPYKVDFAEDVNIAIIACGSGTSYGLTNDGQVYAWGHNCCGQLGNGVINGDVCRPIKIHFSHVTRKRIEKI